jgi:hypothetical protein
LVDEKASSFVRNLMRDLPERKINGKDIQPVLKESYSQVIF